MPIPQPKSYSLPRFGPKNANFDTIVNRDDGEFVSVDQVIALLKDIRREWAGIHCPDAVAAINEVLENL